MVRPAGGGGGTRIPESSRTLASRRPTLLSLLETDQVRRIALENRTLYCVLDVLTVLVQTARPQEYLESLLHRESQLAEFIQHAPFAAPITPEEILPAADLYGVLRIVQSIHHPRAESAKRWLAACGVARLEEAANPELAVTRVRQEYQRRSFPRQWIDQRLRSISARAEIVAEWHRRGAQSSDDYRALTNALAQEAFNMDVETYRQHKGLFGRENLGDQMTEMELALLSLGETVGAVLHRTHGSKTVAELEQDLQTAGGIVAAAREKIEQASGKPVIEGETHPERGPRQPHGGAHGGVRQVVIRRPPTPPTEAGR